MYIYCRRFIKLPIKFIYMQSISFFKSFVLLVGTLLWLPLQEINCVQFFYQPAFPKVFMEVNVWKILMQQESIIRNMIIITAFLPNSNNKLSTGPCYGGWLPYVPLCNFCLHNFYYHFLRVAMYSYSSCIRDCMVASVRKGTKNAVNLTA